MADALRESDVPTLASLGIDGPVVTVSAFPGSHDVTSAACDRAVGPAGPRGPGGLLWAYCYCAPIVSKKMRDVIRTRYRWVARSQGH